MSTGIRKKCCKVCPYSWKRTLFLHPERAEAFAAQAQNPYNDFVCHETGVVIEEGPFEGDIVRGKKSLMCAGFAALQFHETGELPEEGFTTATIYYRTRGFRRGKPATVSAQKSMDFCKGKPCAAHYQMGCEG